MVADGQPGHPDANLLDDAGPLVAADDRVPDRDVAGAQVVVGVAQPGGGEPDKHLAGLRLVEVELDDLERLADVPQHRCSRLHATPSRGDIRIVRVIIRPIGRDGQ